MSKLSTSNSNNGASRTMPEGRRKKRERRRSKLDIPQLRRTNSVTDSVKAQFDELLNTFESLIDGQIPLKNQASKLKTKMDDQRKALIQLIKKRQNMASQKFQRRTLSFRVNVQKSLRTAITGDPNRSIRRHIQEPPQIKFIDKMSFTLSMLVLVVSEFLLLCYPSLFQWFYAAMLIPLMIARYIDYTDKKWHFFMFDFCYFVNFLSIATIFCFPDSEWLFEALFVLANGPVLFAIIVWRNMYAAWQFAYLFKTEVVSKSYLDQHEDIETSLRWLSRADKNSFNKLTRKTCYRLGVMAEGEKFDSRTFKTKAIFVTANFLYYCVTIIPTAILFKHKYAHLGVSLLAILSSIWQGANYYIEVFSERYHDSLEQKAQQIEEQYLFIDENLDHLLNQKWQETQEAHSDISDLEVTDPEYDTSEEYGDGSNQHHDDERSDSNFSSHSSGSPEKAFMEN